MSRLAERGIAVGVVIVGSGGWGALAFSVLRTPPADPVIAAGAIANAGLFLFAEIAVWRSA